MTEKAEKGSSPNPLKKGKKGTSLNPGKKGEKINVFKKIRITRI